MKSPHNHDKLKLRSILNLQSSRSSLKSYPTVSPDMHAAIERENDQSRSLAPTINPIIHFFSPPTSNAVEQPVQKSPPISVLRALSIIAVCVTAFIVSNATSLSLNLLIPSIQRELGIEASDLQWVSSGFPLGYGSCLLLSGRLADLYGHKRFIQIGTTFYGLSSLACALSRTHVQLSIFRVFQGLGAAAIAPSLIGVLGNHLETGSALKRIGFACLSAGAPLGGTFGLLVGGFITEGTRPGWRSFFYLCAASSLTVCFLATIIIPKDIKREGESKGNSSIDWLGGILIMTGLTLLTFSLGISSREGWNKVVVLLPFISSLIILTSFIIWQKHLTKALKSANEAEGDWKSNPEPILKLDLFTRHHHQFSIVLIVVCLLWFGFVVQNFFFHQYLQDYLRLDLTQSVLRFIPMLVLGLLLNITFGFLSHIIPAQLLMVLGCLGTAISCLLSAVMDTSATYWSYNFASVALSVVGPDFVFATGTMFGSQISSKSEQAVTGGLFHTFSQMGNAIGLSIATLLQVEVTRSQSRRQGVIVDDDLTIAPPEAFLQGLRAGFWLCFGSLCVATLLCVIFLRNLSLQGRKSVKVESVSTLEKAEDELDLE